MATNYAATAQLIERRSGCRYPVALEVSYRDLRERHQVVGHGKTINISSSGILFAGEHSLKVHTDVELMVRWPVLLDDEIPLHLKVSGRVMRIDGTRAAVEIQRYEFRISARRAKAQSASVQADATA